MVWQGIVVVHPPLVWFLFFSFYVSHDCRDELYLFLLLYKHYSSSQASLSCIYLFLLLYKHYSSSQRCHNLSYNIPHIQFCVQGLVLEEGVFTGALVAYYRVTFPFFEGRVIALEEGFPLGCSSGHLIAVSDEMM